jgi:hypothetical protein
MREVGKELQSFRVACADNRLDAEGAELAQECALMLRRY